jgi:cytochrome d ubiquinol oxidase subunit I
MTVELLSRIQFAVTISFHFVFPPMTIGLGLILVILQGLRLKTGNPVYLELAHFWTRVFGLIFALGVATGIPMEFQFGTNWSQYARFVGDIFGSPLAIEGIYAFFLESGFLALLLFGWDKVGPRMHFFATCMVALGAHFSAIWILVANSWMQTPAGYHLARTAVIGMNPDGTPITEEVALPAGYLVEPSDLSTVRAVVHDFGEAILNPSTLDRLTHTIFACWITGAFLVVSISAWWLLRGKRTAAARTSLTIGLLVAAIACCLQMVAGDSTARGVAENQPTKLAAMEGLPTTQTDAPLSLFGWVSWKRDGNGEIVGLDEHVVRVPSLLSILVSGKFLDFDAARATEVKGLDDLPSDQFIRSRHPGASDAELARLRPTYWPNVPLVFQTYHLMIALGVLLTMLALAGAAATVTGKIFGDRPLWRFLLWSLVPCIFLAHLATQAGWFTAELGRQPWIVYEVLRTQHATSTVVEAGQVIRSLILFFLIYLFLTALFVHILRRLVRKGPDGTHGETDERDTHATLPISLRGGRQTSEG